MNEWKDLFVATAGASAALTGLIFVGISISLTKILSIPALPNRAFLALTLLMTILVLSVIMLVPRQSFMMQGIEVLLFTAVVCTTITVLDIRIYRTIGKQYQHMYARHVVLDQIASLPYIIGGIVLISRGEAGYYWIVLAIVFSLIKSVFDAWVLLIEINR